MSGEKHYKTRRRSAMWQFFEKINSSVAVCCICSHKVSYRSTTSNLKRHMIRCHQNIDLAALELQLQGGEEDPRESLKEFIALETDGTAGTSLYDEETVHEDVSRGHDTEWEPQKKMTRKTLSPNSKKIKPEVISASGVDYLIYEPQSRSDPSSTPKSPRPNQPSSRTPSAPDEDDFACFARFLSKRIRSLKDPYWQSCAINEINVALHKVEIRRYEPPKICAGSDSGAQMDPHVASEDQFVEEIAPHEEIG